MARKKEKVLNVGFGNVTIGTGTARLGVTLARGQMSLEEVDATFCGHRIAGQVKTSSDDDQQSLIDKELTIDAVFDVTRYGASAQSFTFGLAYSLADIKVEDIAKMARRPGKLTIRDVEIGRAHV